MNKIFTSCVSVLLIVINIMMILSLLSIISLPNTFIRITGIIDIIAIPLTVYSIIKNKKK